MITQFIINDKGEKTAAIIPINEYEDLLHLYQHELELTNEYKTMIDNMLEEEANGKATYVSFQSIKDKFLHK